MIAKQLIPAVTYVRMSDGKQEASPGQQRAELAKLAERCGFKILREYFDEGISGDATSKRKAFLQMHRDACNGRDFDAILAWDQDRFGRFDSIEAGYWIKPLRDAGVRLVTVAQGPIDWNDFTGRIIYSIQQEGKNAYLRDLSRNVARGSRAKAEAGELVIACWGYLKDGLRLVPNPAIAPIIRRIFDEYLRAGTSLRSLCQMLNTEGIPSPSGKAWRTTMLRAILCRRKYTGAYVWGETQRGVYHAAGAAGVITRAKGEANRRGDTIVRDGIFEPIVPLKVFERVQRKLALAKKHTAPFQGGLGDYVLSGMLRCGRCGESMPGRKSVYRGKTRREYACGGYHFGGKARCNRNTVHEQPLVDAIIRKLQTEVLAPEILEAVRAEVRRQLTVDNRTDPATADRLRKRIATLDRQIDQGAERILSAPTSIATTLYAKLETLQDQRRQLQADLEAQERPVEADDAQQVEMVEEAIAALWTLREAISDADEADLRNLLEHVISKVDLYFTHTERACKVQSHFQRGVVHLRPNEIFKLVQSRQRSW